MPAKSDPSKGAPVLAELSKVLSRNAAVSFDPLDLIEAVCLATLAEVERQRAAGRNVKVPPPTRKRRSVPRVVPTSETCAKAAAAALIDLGRAGLVRRGHA